MRKVLLLAVAVAALLFFNGCRQIKEAWNDALNPSTPAFSFGEPYKAKYVMALFQIVNYPRAGELESEISTFDGQKIWINTNQFFSSKNVKEIRMLPRTDRPDCYDLALNLDDRGCRIWTILSHEYRGKELVLMIDGYYQCTFSPQPLANESSTWVVIQHPFDEVTAKGMVKYSQDNYSHLNPSPTRLF